MILAAFVFFVCDFNDSLCISEQEPKLSAARRIVTEWADYDEEMQRLAQQIAKDKAAAAAAAVDQQQAEPSLSRDEL